MTDGRLLARLSRMLKKSASFVLASLRGSTYRSVRLASSLVAALLDSLFEHPARYGAIGVPVAREAGFERFFVIASKLAGACPTLSS